MDIKLYQISSAIANKEIGENVYTVIDESLDNNDIIEIDFIDVSVMTTYCAKQIFGRLYIKLGADEFFRRLIFKNVRNDIKIIIEQGILNAIDSSS